MGEEAMSGVERCIDCNASLGTLRQVTHSGADRKRRCVTCERKSRISWMLKVIPLEGDDAFEKLSEFEQEFIPSVRQQYERRGDLSERQYEIIERIYEKTK